MSRQTSWSGNETSNLTNSFHDYNYMYTPPSIPPLSAVISAKRKTGEHTESVSTQMDTGIITLVSDGKDDCIIIIIYNIIYLQHILCVS